MLTLKEHQFDTVKVSVSLNHRIFVSRSGIYIHSDLNQTIKLVNIFFFFSYSVSLLIT